MEHQKLKEFFRILSRKGAEAQRVISNEKARFFFNIYFHYEQKKE